MVLITGIGVVSPLGCGIRSAWESLIKGQCAIKHLGSEYSELPSQVGARVTGFDPCNYIDKQELRKIPVFAQYAIGAADLALKDANLDRDSLNLKRSGVAIGSGIGGLSAAFDNSVQYSQSGYRKVAPLFVPSLLANMAAGHVSIRTGFRGPNHCVSTACTTGAHSIGDAYNMIKLGMADVMLAGSTEAAVHPLSVAGFARARSLASKFNDTPEQACRPFDAKRDGFVIGEGAAVLLLESERHAKARKARAYAKIRGYGMSGDAHHITAPHGSGRGALECMEMALELGNVKKNEVGYVNAHATSTPLGDGIEARAIASLFGKNACVSSTKGATGHLLGAAGSLEAAFTALALSDSKAPPSLNLVEPDVGTELDFAFETRNLPNLQFAMTNSFGFGGTNASLLLERVD